jgi:hypothetical protein
MVGPIHSSSTNDETPFGIPLQAVTLPIRQNNKQPTNTCSTKQHTPKLDQQQHLLLPCHFAKMHAAKPARKEQLSHSPLISKVFLDKTFRE